MSRIGRSAYLLLGLYWLLLFAGTHLPRVGISGPRFFDKVLHFSAYLVLAVLTCLCVRWRRQLTLPVYLGIVAVLAAYATIDELLQIPIPQRTGDPWDWLADVLGVLAGAAAFAVAAVFWDACRRPAAGRPT